MTACPPVVFLIFRRPELTRRVFAEIRRAQPSRLFIVADGPRASHPDDVTACAAARAVCDEIDWPCEVTRDYSDANHGLRTRVSTGISRAFEFVEEAIVLEDDCLPHPSFFPYCAELLAHYRDDRRILSISGDNYQAGRWRGDGSYYFSKYPTCWGWATWRRAWRLFDPAMAAWPRFRDSGALVAACPDAKERQHWHDVFDATHAGRTNSWAYAWVYTAFAHHALSAHPNRNLIANIGFGPEATHTSGTASFANLPTHDLGPVTHPSFVVQDAEADRIEFQSTHLPAPTTNRDHALRRRVARVGEEVRRAWRSARSAVRPVAPDTHGSDITFTGDYASWESALHDADGYANPTILERVRESARKVRDGSARFERDGVTFDAPQWNFPLLACLLRIAAERGNRLSVLDVGGALGSVYVQSRDFLQGVSPLNWAVVEQARFAACGRQEFQTDALRFFDSVGDALDARQPDVALLSGVLQYVPDPHALIAQIAATEVRWLLVDRTPLHAAPDRIMVQTVPSWVWGGRIRIPIRMLDQDKLLATIGAHWPIALQTDALDRSVDLGTSRPIFRLVLAGPRTRSAT